MIGEFKMTQAFVTGLLCVLVSTAGNTLADSILTDASGPYFGQQPPGMTPEIFGEGMVSTNHSENGLCASADGKELYFTLNGIRPYVMVWTRLEDTGWTSPEAMPFSGNYSDWDFNISPDGKRIYFTTYRPLSGNGEPEDNNNIWVATRTETGWSEPENLGLPISTDGFEGHPSVTKEGTVYFHRRVSDDPEQWYIFRSQLSVGKYAAPQQLPKEINSTGDSYDPFIAADESYLIFLSSNFEKEGFPTNFYISFRNQDGSWTAAKNMGEFIKVAGSTPTVTIDGKYFFFNSYKQAGTPWSKEKLTYEDKIRVLDGPANIGGIYWVDAKIIDALKPEGFD